MAADPMRLEDAAKGCLLGGAIGDALGARIEFFGIDEIRHRFGPDGVTDIVPGYGQRAPITDDTQMTLFTTEGIIRASVRARARGISSPVEVVRHAYLRWLRTQGEPVDDRAGFILNGWLLEQTELHHMRAPGTTCLAALRAGGRGTIDDPANGSKGCGGVMRVAPAGLAWDPATAFTQGAEFAAITHGHPTGWLTGGVLAAVVAGAVAGESLAGATVAARALLAERADTAEVGETDHWVGWALDTAGDGLPSPEALDALHPAKGPGWIAEEALGVALRCALSAEVLAGGREGLDHEHVRAALLAAVNHSGDSDSTGAITGNVLGAAVGVDGLPRRWRSEVEAARLIEVLATDLATELGPDAPAGPGVEEIPEWWWARYPGT